MSSQWVNKYAIMRDLSLVQGCVPVDVAGTLVAGDRPPSQEILEETEEEFYRNCIGSDGDFAPPDLDLIKHMLNLVKEYDAPTDLEVEPEAKVIEITKPDATCSEIMPEKTTDGKASKSIIGTRPKRRQRNAAVASLLLNLENEKNVLKVNTSCDEPVKLLKPEDFSSTEPDSIQKVNGWFTAQEKIQVMTKPKHTSYEKLTSNVYPASMFKKKVSLPPKEEKEIVKSKKAASESYTKVPSIKAELSVDPATVFKKKVSPPPLKEENEIVKSNKLASESYRKVSLIRAGLKDDPASMFTKNNSLLPTKTGQEIVISKMPESESSTKVVPSIKVELNVDPKSMFKKKDLPSPPKPEGKPVESKKSTHVYSKFVPSSKAEEYYKKFLESSKMKEMITEDVWMRAERQMREIDERRKQEAELFAKSLALSKSTNSPATSTDLEDPRLDVVRLPQHRHTLKGQCIVCAVMTKTDPKTEHSEAITCLCSSDDEDKDMETWRSRAEDTINYNIENWRCERVHDENMESWRQRKCDIDTLDKDAE